MKKILEIAAGAAKKAAGTALALVGKGFSLCLSAVRHAAAAARHLTAKVTGKAAHCVFIAGLVATYFHDWFAQVCAGWPLTPDLLLLWLGVCITLCALVFYVSDAIRKAKEKGII